MRLRLLTCMLMGMRRGRCRSVWSLVSRFIRFSLSGAVRFFTYIGAVLCWWLQIYIHTSPTVAARRIELRLLTALFYPSACTCEETNRLRPSSLPLSLKKNTPPTLCSIAPLNLAYPRACPLWLGIHPNECVPAQVASQPESANRRPAASMHLTRVYRLCTLRWYRVQTNEPSLLQCP
jgi:hypothetical protein